MADDPAGQRPLTILYRDVDRAPYLCVLADQARRRGLQVQLRRHALRSQPSAPDWSELLLKGEVDIIAENYWGLQLRRAEGAPLVSLACVVNHWPEQLVVQPSLTCVADLRGGRFALRSNGPQRLFPPAWIRDRGISDVDFVLVAEGEVGRWGHWKRVADGTCRACMVANLYLQPALDAGLTVIPYDPPAFAGGNVVLTTTESLLRARRGELQTLVDATFATTGLFKAAHPVVDATISQQCLPLLSEHFGALSDAAVSALRALLAAELSDLPIPTAEGIDMTWRMARQTGKGDLSAVNPLLMWDLSLARATLGHRLLEGAR
jgi:hypothetical protein